MCKLVKTRFLTNNWWFQSTGEKPLLQRMAEEKRLQMERGSIGGSYFMVQLPDGTMEKRLKVRSFSVVFSITENWILKHARRLDRTSQHRATKFDMIVLDINVFTPEEMNLNFIEFVCKPDLGTLCKTDRRLRQVVITRRLLHLFDQKTRFESSQVWS